MPETIATGPQPNVKKCPFCGTAVMCVKSDKLKPPESHRYKCSSPVCGKSWEIDEIVGVK